MNMHKVGSIAVFATLVILGGCAGEKVSGVGAFASTSGVQGESASFRFDTNLCDATQNVTRRGIALGAKAAGTALGNFSFQDKNAPAFPNGGVKLKGNVTSIEGHLYNNNGRAAQNTQAVDYYFVLMEYESTNSHYPGSGEAYVLVLADAINLAEKQLDGATMQITTGPYSGLFIYTGVEGRIAVKACK